MTQPTPSCCFLGSRADIEAISVALRGGESTRSVAARYAASKSSVLRHRAGCLGLVAEVRREVSEEPEEAVQDQPGPDGDQSEPAAPEGGQVVPDDSPQLSAWSDEPPAPRLLGGIETEDRCMALRVKGYTYEEIEAETGIGRNTARAAVVRAVERKRERIGDRADELREIALDQCCAILKSLLPRASDASKETVDVPADTESGVRPYDGQDKAVAGVLKTLERIAKLFGCDAPTAAPPVVVNISLGGQRVETPAADIVAVMEDTFTVLEDFPEARAAVLEFHRSKMTDPKRLR